MNKRTVLDTVMLFVFLLLLDLRWVHVPMHESLAILFTVLVMIHTRWNWSWYKSLSRGRWNGLRKLMTVIDGLLVLLFLTIMVSGLSFSQYVLPFGMRQPLWVHRLHRVAGFIMIFVMGLHLGIHWQYLWPRMKRAVFGRNSRIPSFVWHGAALLIAAFGVYNSFLYNLGSRILLVPASQLQRPPVTLFFFLLAHLSIIGLYTAIGYYAMKWSAKRR